MDKLVNALKSLRGLFLAVTETGLAFIGFILVIYILLGGESGDFVLSVVTNVSLLVDALSPQTIVAVTLVVGAVAILRNRR